jgi:hypothetical protein
MTRRRACATQGVSPPSADRRTPETVVPPENNGVIADGNKVAATKEEVMNPVLMQDLAAERIRESQAHASAAGRARQAQRSLSARRFARSSRAARNSVFVPAARPLRGARPA